MRYNPAMIQTIDELTQGTLALPPDQRFTLARRILASAEPEVDPVVNKAWTAVIGGRIIRGKQLPLTAAGLQALRGECARSIEPARVRAAEALKLECELSDLVNQAYGLTPGEIALMWKTAPPRMPIPMPANCSSGL